MTAPRSRGWLRQVPARASAACLVPSTRARTLANAFWRLVDWSFAKGEKSASSQVPSWSAGDVAGRAKDAVADFLRSFHARVARVGDTDEHADVRPQLVGRHLQSVFRV